MKKHRTDQDNILYVADGDETYAIPRSVAKVYKIELKKAVQKKGNVLAADAFKALRKDSKKAASLLRGLRNRENLSQVEFAKRINITQANLSKLECGHRPIGKIIAKRIAKEFDVDYRCFLE